MVMLESGYNLMVYIMNQSISSFWHHYKEVSSLDNSDKNLVYGERST